MAALSKLKNSFTNKDSKKGTNLKQVRDSSASDSSLLQPRRGDTRFARLVKEAAAKSKEHKDVNTKNSLDNAGAPAPLTSPNDNTLINPSALKNLLINSKKELDKANQTKLPNEKKADSI